MKKLTSYIIEKLKISKKTNFDPNSKRNGIEVINNVDCKALPYVYVDAIIDAYIASPLKKDVSKIEVFDAKSYFDNDPQGIKENTPDRKYLYNSAYPAIKITWTFNDNKMHKRDTLRHKMPYIIMPLILTDDKGLFTKRNSYNITGLRDVECSTVGYTAKRLNDKTEYSYVIIYTIKPEATKKLLSEQEIYNNLLKYYKVKYNDRPEYLKELSDKFYTDDRRNKYGILDLDEKRSKECKQHMNETW